MSKDGADVVHFFHDKSRPNQKILFQRGDEIKTLVRTNHDVRRQFAKSSSVRIKKQGARICD